MEESTEEECLEIMNNYMREGTQLDIEGYYAR
jgi:hypothetical protein